MWARSAAATLAAGTVVAGTLAACGQSAVPKATPGASTTAARLACTVPAPFSGSHQMTLSAGGVVRRYVLHLPPGVAKGRALPLVLGLHGTGGKAGFFEQQSGLSRVADREGFATVFPYALGTPSRWTLPGQEGPDDEAFVRALLTTVRGQACVDPRRVSAFGHSNGGGFAVALACAGDVGLAGAVSASGAYGAQERCEREPPPPLLEIHGDADPIVPYAPQRAFLDTWARWAGCAPRPRRAPGADGSVRERFVRCRPGAALEHLRRPGANHDLPASAAPAAWAFLRSRRR